MILLNEAIIIIYSKLFLSLISFILCNRKFNKFTNQCESRNIYRIIYDYKGDNKK